MNGKINHLSQIAYARRYTLTEGTEAGIKVVEVYNGRIRFLLNESKALDMMQLFDGEVNISFLSKNGFHLANLDYKRRFEGGMLYTCGLDNAGSRDGYEVHGTLHTTPATITEISVTEDEIKVVGTVRASAHFEGNLLFTRTITTKVGSGSVTISDTLENQGYTDSEYCLLYHVNVGYPMLDEGVRIVQDEESVIPRNGWAKVKFEGRNTLTDCIDGEEEQCYYVTHKTPHVEVVNDRIGRKFSLDYSKDTLPYFVQWNSRMSGDYAQGLEPTTTFLDDTFKRNKISVGEKVNFFVKFTVDRF
ncbi:MAG: DUF4432 family protein [Clostridia bacterium]|nr:DUF4432 family protein [Clostridia bacterium]